MSKNIGGGQKYMRLSNYDSIYFKVIRDGEFDALGLIHKTLRGNLLVYAQSESFVNAACEDPYISCVLCTEDLAENSQLLNCGKGIAICELPRTAFILFHNYLLEKEEKYKTEYPATRIGINCKLHPTASIATSGVTIGDNVTIEEFVVIREGSYIGNNAIIHAGAVIGADNYDFSRDEEGHIVKMQQTGQTYLGENVEVGCHTVIGRALFPYQKTMIGENTCIESLVIISHASQIGSDCYIGGKVNICGSVKIEDGVRINPMATVKDSVKIGRNAIVSLGSVVVNNVPEQKRVTGNFAIDHTLFLKNYLNKLRSR